MNALQAEEVLDLELISALVPMCEDDHVWFDEETDEQPPPCSRVATARLIMSCSKEVTLICAALEGWLGDRTECTPHSLHSHTRILGL